MNKVVLPPLPSHPEPMIMKWSPLELAALRARDLEVARVVLEAAAKACGHLAQADAVAANIRALEVSHAD